jgi:protein-S-isoprenylcysteine O-methyltransferase Ste14
VLILFGFLLQWPTLMTLAMFPVLVVMYVRLAISEEKKAQRVFAVEWTEYALRRPRCIPRFGAVPGVHEPNAPIPSPRSTKDRS